MADHEPTGPAIENDEIVCTTCGLPVWIMSSEDGDSAWMEHK